MLSIRPQPLLDSRPSQSPIFTDDEARARAIYLLDHASFDLIYGREERDEIARLARINGRCLDKDEWRHHPEILAGTEVIFSGWGAPCMDAEFLAAAPRLKAVFYGAGSIRPITSEAFWERDILISSAYAANAVPVAEYTVATTLLSLRQFWRRSAAARLGEGWGDHTRAIPGSFRATVGLLSFGMIARKAAELFRAFDVRILVYCPFLTAEQAAENGVERVSLEALFARSDVVSIHTPVLRETIGMVNGALIASMRPGATLINTARGQIINQPELVSALKNRPDLTAILDVTNPEPPPPDDPLFSLANTIVTSHIAGSHGRDCKRMGSYMVDEFKRFLEGRPLHWRLTREKTRTMA